MNDLLARQILPKMKKITITLAALIASLCLSAQTYILDESFGDNGTKFNNGVDFFPLDGLVFNNNYYFISQKSIGKVNSSGTIDATFGSDGFVTLDSNDLEYFIYGFKHIGNYIYVYGAVNDSNDNDDAFVCKIDEAGNFDASFGTNNFAKIEFNGWERITDLVLDNDGNIYCTGLQDTSGSSKLIYFKLNANGTLNTAFDANGFKELLLNNTSHGYSIIKYGENYLLTGTDNHYEDNQIRHEMLFVSLVDNSGNLITSFGTNGSITADLDTGSNINIRDVQLADNNLYVNFFHEWSFNNQGSNLMRLDLVTGQTIFNNPIGYAGGVAVEGNTIYITSMERCQPVTESYCERDFTLSRKLLDGTADPTFQNNNNYTYSFPAVSPGLPNYSDDSAVVVLKDNGKIVLAGTTNIFNYGSGFSLIRLKDSELSLNDVSTKMASIFPNPFNDFVTVESGSQIKDIQVMDVSGRVISTPNFTMEGEAARVNLETLQQSGMYLMQVTTIDNKTFTRKIIKQ